MAEDIQEVSAKSKAAKVLATVALLLSLLALFWAVKADKRANDAFQATQPVTQQEEVPPTTSEGTTPTDQGVNSNGNGTTEGTNGIPPEAPTVDP